VSTAVACSDMCENLADTLVCRVHTYLHTLFSSTAAHCGVAGVMPSCAAVGRLLFAGCSSLTRTQPLCMHWASAVGV
jgi:hypothetical protein